MNCEGRFRLKTMRLGGKLCANCFKIHESVQRTVQQFGGTFNLVVKRPGQVDLILSCSQGHTWRIGMQSRKAKNGCRQCKDQSRVENARRQFEEQAREREEQERQQRVLLDQNVTDIPVTSNHTHEQNIQLDLMNEIFVQQLLRQRRNPMDLNLQTRVTDLVLDSDASLLTTFLQQLENQSRENTSILRQLVQRLRLAIHPDKNHHPRAGEAFARIT